MSGDRQNKILTFLLVLVAVVAIVTFLGVGRIVLTGATSESVKAAQRSTDLRTCTSKARAPLEDARTAVEVLILDGLSAGAERNVQRYAELLEAAPVAKANLELATAAYKADVVRSATDPDGFLADCDLTQGD